MSLTCCAGQDSPRRRKDASRALPDPVELDDVLLFLVPYGVTRDDLISEMGGSP
jgi:hypothetical protein